MRVVALQARVLLAALAVAGTPGAHAEGSPDAPSAADAPSTPSGSEANPDDARAHCVLEHEQTQIARMREALLSARAAALSCSQAECPALLRADCVQWFAELDREVPSIVISVRAERNDVSTAAVLIDGQPAARALDGQPLELDPGHHRFEVVLTGQAPQRRELVLAAGEKARLLVFEEPSSVPAVSAPVATSLSRPRPTHRPVPTLTWVLAGSSVAALGVGAVFGGLALSQRHSLEQAPANGGCSPYCTDGEVAPVHQRALAADVLFGVAAASAAGAIVSYILRPEVPLASGNLDLDFELAPTSARIGLRGRL